MVVKDLVFVNDTVKTQDEALMLLSHKAKQMNLLTSVQEFVRAVYKRESEYSTAVGFGIAIPHGMSDTVKKSFIAFMKPKESILWGNDKVNLIFLIGVPQTKKEAIHLKFLSQICKYLMREDFRNVLLSCHNSEEAYDYLNKINRDIEEELKCL